MREELLVFLVMMGVAVLGSALTRNHRKWLPAVLFAGAVAGSLASGMGLRFREIVEGAFAFLDTGFTVLCAAVFIRLYRDGGGFDGLFAAVTRIKNHTLRTLVLLCMVALPGIFTGSALACVLIGGPAVSAYMKKRGIADGKITQFVAVGALLGMMLPPNCIPAMIAANGGGTVLPVPYAGFFLPLLIISLPALIAYGLVAQHTIFGGEADTEPAAEKTGFACQIPLVIVSLLLLADGVLGSLVYVGGHPVIFSAGILLCLALPAKRRGVRETVSSVFLGLEDLLSSVALMFALGCFIEVGSMTGVRGLFSLYVLPLEGAPVLLFSMAAILALGVPFSVAIPSILAAFAVLQIGWLPNAVLVAGCSAALGVAALLAVRGGIVTQVRRELGLNGGYFGVLGGAWLPASLMLGIGALMVIFGGRLAWLIV